MWGWLCLWAVFAGFRIAETSNQQILLALSPYIFQLYASLFGYFLEKFKVTRISEMPAVGRGFISNLQLPTFEDPAWTTPVPASQRRVSIVSTAAVSRRGDKPFSWLAKDHRTFHKNDRDLVMTHVAVEFDRSAWQQDLNVIIPLDRLEEMAQDGEIGSVADEHYSFMGAADPVTMEKSARAVADQMKQEGVNTVFLIPI
mgnify:FL=1